MTKTNRIELVTIPDLDQLLDTLDSWTDEEALEREEGQLVTDPQVLRFLAHLVIVLRRVVPNQVDFSKGQNVLRQYVQFGFQR